MADANSKILFTIHCATCRTPLTVRDTAAVGQILPCPKCGSMVLVRPDEEGGSYGDPADAPPPPAAKRVADSFVEDSQDDIDTILSDSAEWTQGQPPAEQLAPDDATDDGAAADADSEPVTPQPMLPGDHWTSPETRQLRRWLSIAVGGVAIVALSIAGVGFLLSRASGGPDLAQNQQAPDEDDPKSGGQATSEANQQSSAPGDQLDSQDPDQVPPPTDTENHPNPNPGPDAPVTDANDQDSPSESPVGTQIPTDAPPESGQPAEPTTPQLSPANLPPGMTPRTDGGQSGLGAALDDLDKMLVKSAEPKKPPQDDPSDYVLDLPARDDPLLRAIPMVEPPAVRRLDAMRQFSLPLTRFSAEQTTLQ